MTQKSQYRQAQDLVEKLQRIDGVHPGYRTVHADGRLYQGTFRANETARAYTRAVHLQGNEVPVTVRYSKGSGDPFAHFKQTVGMATRFYLPDGRVTHLVMLNQPTFVASTVEQFIALLDAGMPSEPGGPINMAGLDAFLKANPNVSAAIKLRNETLAPTSFAHTEFNSIHAFHYVNAAGVATSARCHWMPVAGITGQARDALSQADLEVLFLEMENRLKREQVSFDLALELAEPGDPLNDPSAIWPKGRRRVAIGRLTLTGPITEEEIGDPLMNHDPTMLTDGIDPTDDPILQIRRGVYEISAAQRSGGWHHGAFGQAHEAK